METVNLRLNGDPIVYLHHSRLRPEDLPKTFSPNIFKDSFVGGPWFGNDSIDEPEWESFAVVPANGFEAKGF